MNYDDLPLEVLQDLWVVRFGMVSPYEDAHNAVVAGEVHWNDVFEILNRSGWARMHSTPMRIVINQEDPCSGPAAPK